MHQDHKHMYNLCKDHMHAYVLAEVNDGTKFDGIVTGLDDEYVYFAVPLDHDYPSTPEHNQSFYPENNQRQFGYPGYGYPGYGGGYGYPGYGPGFGGYPGYGYGYPRRRFRRLVLPLAALTALSVLPWY